MCGNPKVGSVSVFRNPNRTVAKKSNPNFGFPRLFLKTENQYYEIQYWNKKPQLFPNVSLFLFNVGVIFIMKTMKMQYHQVLQHRRLCLRQSNGRWPVRTIVTYRWNRTAVFSQNRTEIQKSILHNPSTPFPTLPK